MNRNPKKERGAVAIETALTLPVFMLAILALMLGSMLFRAQSMMQYALNQTAKEISGYFYLIDKLGLATVLSGSATDATNAQIQNVNNTIYDVLAFSGDIKDTTGQIVEDGEAVQDSVQESIFAVEDLVNNPMDLEENAENLSASVDTIVENTENLSDDAKEALELYKADFQKIKNDLKVIKGADKKTMIVSTLQIFGKAFLNRAFAEVATPIICNAMMPKYLTDGDESAFFEATGIIEDSIDFTGSRMLHDGKTISLIVQYKIDASKLTLGFYKKELTFQHVAVTSAWLRNYDTGSLKTLKEINDTFDPDKLAEHADELNALYAELEAERLANEKEKQDKIDELNIQKADETTTVTTLEETEQTTTTTTTTEPPLVEKADFEKVLETETNIKDVKTLYDNLNKTQKFAFRKAFSVYDDKGNSVVNTDLLKQLLESNASEDIIRFITAPPYDSNRVKLYASLGNKDVVLAMKDKDGNFPENSPEISSEQIFDILSQPKGSRPDPSTYLSKEYIDKHMENFKDGVVYIQKTKDYEKYTKNKGLDRGDGQVFVMPKSVCDKVFAEAAEKFPNADQDQAQKKAYCEFLSQELGFDEDYFKSSGITKIEIPGNFIDVTGTDSTKLGVRIPSGNELGANGWWVPGGYTSGGTMEAIIDKVPWNIIEDNNCATQMKLPGANQENSDQKTTVSE